MALVELARFYNSFEAGLARSVLAEHGIESVLFDFNVSTEGGSFAMPIRLMADEGDLDEGRRILESGLEP
jgi:hypothetical protein